MTNLAVTSVVTGTYMPWARALGRSLSEQNPDVRLYICLVDRPRDGFDPAGEPFTLFFADELGIPDWPRFAFQYSALELCCALKPHALQHVWQTTDAQCLLYLDSDMHVYGSMDALSEETKGHSVILTPHLLSPGRNTAAREAETRRSGIFNGGCVAVRRTPEAEAFLTWWRERLYRHCTVDVRAGVFVDQSWLDLVPSYFPNALILRNAGFNAGYWNLAERPLTRNAAGDLLAGNARLVCFHFSGFDPDKPQRLSCHREGDAATETPALKEIRQRYADRLKQCGHRPLEPHAYGFAKLKDGTPIDPTWREAIRQGRLPEIADPFDTDATPDLMARLKWEGAECWGQRLDWRYAAQENLCNAEEQWRTNYWRLASTFPINLMLWVRRRLRGLDEPAPDRGRRKPPVLMHSHRCLQQEEHAGKSETSRCRARLAPFCEGYGLDLGFGGDPIIDGAIRVDMPLPYTAVGDCPVQLGGNAAQLHWFQDGVLDYIFSSHLLEDFEDTEPVLREWLRVLKPGGRLILYCPDEQRYRRHCAQAEQSYNTNHRQPDFSLAFVKGVLGRLGQTRFLHEQGAVEEYSWELVCEKQLLPGAGSGTAC